MQFKVFIGLVFKVYEPLYHALQIKLACGNFGGLFYYYYFSFLYFGGAFNKTIIAHASR